jgi:hypothetical protein
MPAVASVIRVDDATRLKSRRVSLLLLVMLLLNV